MFAYSGNPATSTTDRVRFLMQDTVAPGLLSNEEVDWLLLEETGDYYAASAEGCRVLARKFAGQPGSKSIGDVSISYSDLVARYTSLAVQIDARGARKSVPVPYLGGLLVSDKEANDSNSDHVERVFVSDEQWSNGDGRRAGSDGNNGMNIGVTGNGYGGGY